MHVITEEHIKALKEYTGLLQGHEKVECVYRLLVRIFEDNGISSRKQLVKEVAKEKEVSSPTLHKWYSSYFKSGVDVLLDDRIIIKNFLLENPYLITKDSKLCNWNKRNLCKYVVENKRKLSSITLKETRAYEILNKVIDEQDELLENCRCYKMVIDFAEAIKQPGMSLIAKKNYILYSYSYTDIDTDTDMSVVTKNFEALIVKKAGIAVKGKVAERKNIEYLATGILKTLLWLKNTYGIKGYYEVRLLESEVSYKLCEMLNGISIKSIRVNTIPIDSTILDEEDKYALCEIEKYKEKVKM